jgi:hypothetical protein
MDGDLPYGLLLDRLYLFVFERLADVNRRIVALGEDPLAILSVGEGCIEENYGLAVTAAETEIALIPIGLLEPAKIRLVNLQRALAASAYDLLRPFWSD